MTKTVSILIFFGILLSVGVLAGGGWYLYKEHQKLQEIARSVFIQDRMWGVFLSSFPEETRAEFVNKVNESLKQQ